MQFRPLGIVKEIVNEAGLDISYAYDDLVFVEHSVMIIKFCDDKPKNIEIFFNTECEKEAKVELMEKIEKEAKEREFSLINKGEFKLKEDAKNENLEITFLEK